MSEGVNEPTHETSSLQHYLTVLRRRKLVVLQALILVPVLTLIVTLQQQPLYKGYSEVLLSRQNLANSLTDTADPNVQGGDFETITQTQAKLAAIPAVAERVIRELGLRDVTPSELLKRTEIEASPDSDLLEFEVRDEDPELAARLTTEYARQYTLYKRRLDTASIVQAREEVQDRIRDLNDPGSPLQSSLVEKDEELSTLEALQVSNATLIRPSQTAEKIQPRPRRNMALGLLLGLLAGIGLAFLRDALDARVRSEDEVARLLGLPLLAGLHEHHAMLARRDQLATLTEPHSPSSEPFRMLRMKLELASPISRPRSLMVTSAIESEGKSTTAANLAVSLARAGRRVALVDLDLRQPSLHRFFGVDQGPGVTSVVIGSVELEEALRPIHIKSKPEDDQGGAEATQENGLPVAPGELELLTAGPHPPNPGEFVGTPAIGELLARLQERFDVVVVDATPMLPVGDAIAVSQHVGAVMVVVRLRFTKRPALRELARILAITPAAKVGFVATGIQAVSEYGYDYRQRYYFAEDPRQSERV